MAAPPGSTASALITPTPTAPAAPCPAPLLSLIHILAQAIDGGATFVQLREKCLDEHDLLAEAEELSALCHFRHVPFVIDDNVEVALAAGADGVHVGQSDMAAKRARALLGPDKILRCV